ncbi:hypothetical protein BD779DRAFT_1492068 [Infundibulicybe gibba]|nr:hypothetical protein BD779DRAFT_1492068 [Infundibulicybe gibba]
MHFLFTPNHVQLLNSCYPPTSALLTAGPEYSPNAQELSRLTYYASNHPSKLTKLGGELEKRLRVECRKARDGNTRTRASLLITLSIFRALATECRREIALLSPSLMASVEVTISTLPADLEVVARAATVVTAWTTYTDGHLVGTDSNMTRDYISALRHFSSLSCCRIPDLEVKNRTRLIGFAAITGALNSEALYNDSQQFREQVSIIMRPILATLLQTTLPVLNEQAAAVRETPRSPYLAEFRTRPAIERRAASIHVHVDGDKGPPSEDVSNASLHAMFSLLEHANGAQLGYIMHSSFDNLDESNGWAKMEHCCWFAQRTAEWSQYQYRYAVPTWLVERLAENQEAPKVTPLHSALAAMVTTVFNSPTPLVNLSTSDIISNLITILIRRTAIDAERETPLLPALVECITSLGKHVYYSDQIQDLAGELISRLTTVEVQGVLARGKPGFNESRTMAIRYLLAGLIGLVRAADKYDPGKAQDDEATRKPAPPAKPLSPTIELHDRSSRRTRIPPDIWQDTLSLLCDNDYAVRADYSEALVFYLVNEMPKHGDYCVDADGVRRTKRLGDGLVQHTTVNINTLIHSGHIGTRFLNAMHAYIYILATTSSLGLVSSSSTSPDHSTHEVSHVNVTSPSETNLAISEARESPPHTNGRRSFSASQGPQSRKILVVQRLLERTPSRISMSTSASLSDYSHILSILSTVYEQFPICGLITGTPMLLALDTLTRSQDADGAITSQRIVTIREVITRLWLMLGKVWSCSELVEIAEQALSTMPPSSSLPTVPQLGCESRLLPREVIAFPTEAKYSSGSWLGVNVEAALTAITSSRNAQDATGLDAQGLLRRLSIKWTADSALRDSIERNSSFESSTRGDGISPLLKISPALMHIENISLQSLARSTRAIGVTDLREALEGRSSMSNPALAKAPSISTLDHASSILGGDASSRLTQTRSRSRTKKRAIPSGSAEVRDVLNKLGIGKQNGSLLKASFPTLQKATEPRASPSKS